LRETFDRWRSQGRSILFTSHDMGWGAAVADRAIMLSGGTVSEDLAAPEEAHLVDLLKEAAK
ncbi:MAG: ABC transporter ATP-binding protein, partial [Candidatus Marinimicrobia bacterium]|nr:ABC transporter ATP-binding protein [Candidatus Neomarinimicrobiota bacterium]